MSTGKAILLALGAVAALAGVALATVGGVLLWADATQTDEDGFLTSGDVRLATEQYALMTEDIDLGAQPGEQFLDEGELTFRVTVTPTAEGGEVFLGIAPFADVDAYLDGVAHERIRRITPDGAGYDRRTGERVPAPPASQDIWAVTAEGQGPTTLTWDARPGSWALVVMDPDGDRGIAVTASGAVRFGLLDELAVGALAGGIVTLVVAVALLVVATTMRATPAAAAASAGPSGTDERAGDPVRLEGTLDDELSRWLPLVKWVLVIPHVIVLVFLWAAFVLLTVVAGIVILATGRYPRGIFDVNVGVLRWTWRVLFYSYGALGTDRYPPFSLHDDPDHPARLDVAYPGELSRGLVLVKWWLLALPHYLVVGVLTTGLVGWTTDIGLEGGAQRVTSLGLIDVLVLIVVFSLLFAGRYPRGIFDLVVGLQRWAFRVVAYAALMTDRYPPFRLDLGGDDPSGHPPTRGPGAPDEAVVDLSAVEERTTSAAGDPRPRPRTD